MRRAAAAGHGDEDMAATIHASRPAQLMARALIIVDYQNDFARPDGALSVPGGEEIAGAINAHAASGDYDLVLATRDWHPRRPRLLRGAGRPVAARTACRAPRARRCTPTSTPSRST